MRITGYVMRRAITMIVVVAALAAAVAAHAANAAPGALQVQDGGFSIGSRVLVADPEGLNVRAAPGLEAEIISYLPYQSAAYVAEGPESVDDYTWYRLEELGQDIGWVAGEFLSLVQRDGPPGPFEMVVIAEPALNVRAEPGLDGEIIDVLPYGTAVTIDGPAEVADGYTWREIDGGGWVAIELLAVSAPGNPGDPDGWAPGTRVVVNTDGLNVRAGAGLDYEVVNVLPTGYVAFINEGPVQADGYDWYRIDAMGVTLGWVAGEFLAAESDELFERGDSVVVNTDWLNLREAPGTGSAVVDVLANGTGATVLGLPANPTDDGYLWVNIETDEGAVGWVAGEFLARA